MLLKFTTSFIQTVFTTIHEIHYADRRSLCIFSNLRAVPYLSFACLMGLGILLLLLLLLRLAGQGPILLQFEQTLF